MEIRERAFTANGLIVWLVLSSVFYGTGAVLKTLYAEDMCYWSSSTKLSLRYQNSAILNSVPNGPLECDITLEPERDSSVVIAFYQYNLGPDDSLVFRDRHNFALSLGGEGYFLDERKSISFDGPVTIHYATNNTHGPNSLKFQLVYTQVHDEPCESHEFKCRNNKCIPKDLACDGHNHCGNVRDQQDCGPRASMKEEVIQERKVTIVYGPIIIIVGGVILLIVVIAITAVLIRGCVRRKKESQQSQLPTVAAAPGVQQATAPPISGPIGQSFRSGHQRTAPPLQTFSAPEYAPESYEIPSMYPHLSSVPHLSGIDNPEFKSEE